MKPASIFPRHAAEILRQAGETPIPPHDPLARRKAVDKAIERVKREYPSYFRQESSDDSTQGGGK